MNGLDVRDQPSFFWLVTNYCQWGSKTYWQIGRLVLQITEYDNGPQWDDFKSAVIYLLPDSNSKAA